MALNNEFLVKRVQKFTYNVDEHGGTFNTAIEIGRLPANALIVGGYAKVTTAITDSDDGNDTTISLGYTGAATAFLAATACNDLTDNAVFTLLPGQAALGVDAAHDTAVEVAALVAASYINLTAEKSVLVTISNSATNIDTGKMDIFIEYVISE